MTCLRATMPPTARSVYLSIQLGDATADLVDADATQLWTRFLGWT
jgi:hypothetical protein